MRTINNWTRVFLSRMHSLWFAVAENMSWKWRIRRGDWIGEGILKNVDAPLWHALYSNNKHYALCWNRRRHYLLRNQYITNDFMVETFPWSLGIVRTSAKKTLPRKRYFPPVYTKLASFMKDTSLHRITHRTRPRRTGSSSSYISCR